MVGAERLLGSAGARVALLGRGRQSSGDLDQGRARLLRSPRHDSRLAVPDRFAAAARARLERVQHRGRDREGSDRPHPRAVPDHPGREVSEGLFDADVLRERGSAGRAPGPGGLQPAARSSEGGLVDLLYADPDDRSGRPGRPAPRPAAGRSAWGPARRGCSYSSRAGTPRSPTSPPSCLLSTNTRGPREQMACRHSSGSTRQAWNHPPAHSRACCSLYPVRSTTRWRSTPAAASPTGTASRTSHGSSSSPAPAARSGTTTSRPRAGWGGAPWCVRFAPHCHGRLRRPARPQFSRSSPVHLRPSRRSTVRLGSCSARSRRCWRDCTRCAAIRSWSTPGRHGADRVGASSVCSRPPRHATAGRSPSSAWTQRIRPSDARAFMNRHPVSYPSYQSTRISIVSSLAQIQGLPTTIFLSRARRGCVRTHRSVRQRRDPG